MEELTPTVRNNADNARQANRLVEDAAHAAASLQHQADMLLPAPRAA